MEKTIIVRNCLLLLMLLLIISLPSVVQAYPYRVSVTWGSTYHPTGDDPDPNWWSTYEQPAQSYTASYITSLSSGLAGPNWIGNNFYGSSTTSSYVYQCSDSIEDTPYYVFLATFHVGDMYPKMIEGGSWEIVGYYWEPNYQIWIPIYEWVVTGTTRHYAYYGSQGTSNGIVDKYLYPHTGSKHRFTFIYTCVNGGLIDIDGNGSYDCYGFVDTQNGTEIVGMPYAWTKKTNLSWNGYASPDSNDYAYIGFENISKWMCDNSEFGYYNYGDFVRRFYDYALGSHYSINDALDMAMLQVTLGMQDFGDSVLYNGYNAYAFGQTWKSRMRVFGDGSMNLPY